MANRVCSFRNMRDIGLIRKMPIRHSDVRWVFFLSLLFYQWPVSSARTCELRVVQGGTVYDYNLASPRQNYPHGIRSEDGFYKVAANESLLWFQLCDNMIFNHDPPRCFDCQGCGGSSRCGVQCSAVILNSVGGYPVCSALGQSSSQNISLFDKKYPSKGVTVKMSVRGPKQSCSLSVSVLCNPNKAQGPNSMDVLGTCDFATVITHPSGCPNVISGHGSGGWFGTLMIVIFCLFGAYLLVGAVYRFFFLRIHGLEAIPNLSFWLSLPQRGRSLLGSMVRRLRGQSSSNRGSYAPANY